MPRRRKKRNRQASTPRPPQPKRNQFIVPYSDQSCRWRTHRWAVKKEGSNRVTITFQTQEEAIEYGRDLAITQRCELVIHDRHGNVRKRRDYSNPRYAALRYEQLMAMYAARRASLESSTPSSENALNN
jgi:Uncharacterized protein conserved in bacteria (DUF2188)